MHPQTGKIGAAAKENFARLCAPGIRAGHPKKLLRWLPSGGDCPCSAGDSITTERIVDWGTPIRAALRNGRNRLRTISIPTWSSLLQQVSTIYRSEKLFTKNTISSA
jgi:hypothetical protein